MPDPERSARFGCLQNFVMPGTDRASLCITMVWVKTKMNLSWQLPTFVMPDPDQASLEAVRFRLSRHLWLHLGKAKHKFGFSLGLRIIHI